MYTVSKNWIILLFILWFTAYSIQSQMLDDTLSSANNLRTNDLNFSKVQTPSVSNHIYSYCDEDGDGYMEIDIASIEREILAQEGVEDNDSETIMISTSYGMMLKLSHPFSEGNIEIICVNSPVGGTDIAVDENGTLFPCSFDGIKRVDLNDCSTETLFSFNLEDGLNSLSFDTSNNLYYGFGTSSEVFRYDGDGLSPPYVWHDFETGVAGGDFVILNDKLYISWKYGQTFKLLEVTVDNNINYISHIELGILPSNTYGLASELGQLYGVTPEKLFKVNLENVSFDQILVNDGTFGDWWGAAGLHEAIEVEAHSYVNMNDALTQQNALTDIWTNSQLGGQTMYIRIDNLNQGTFEIHPITISIGRVPQITQPNNLLKCSNDSNPNFELTDVEDELLQNVNQDVVVTYHLGYYEMLNGVTISNTDFFSESDYQVIYVKVKSFESDCNAWFSFGLEKFQAPNLEPLVSNASERMLPNCYINSMEQGYFKLDEIYDQVIHNPAANNVVQFYASYENAQDGIFELSTNYNSTMGLVEELFIKVTNEEGCVSITNFYIDGDCVLSSPDLSNLYFPKFFTPNNDGFNDYWNIKGVSRLMREKSQISIYNRYGKKLTTFKPSEEIGWNGVYESYNLPSDDYWFRLTTMTGHEFGGHFSLKR